MGSEIQPAGRKRQVLLVSIPGDELASNLVDLLRARKVDVLVAQTVGLASRADEYAICIIILRSGIWRTSPVITTAVRTNPRFMIPVLAEPMSLPQSIWATDAFSISEPLSAMAQELAVLITKELQLLARAGQPTVLAVADNKPTITKEKGSRRISSGFKIHKGQLNLLYSYILVTLIIVLAVVLLVYYYGT